LSPSADPAAPGVRDEEAEGLPESVELSELGSGLRVITEAMPAVRSVALGLWVRTGSRDEDPGQAGLSHFLEHLLFKGTPRWSAIEISEELDGMGASANAATGKESTHLFARFLDEHTDEAFELMAEMLTKPTLPGDEVDSEREVILEEIAMYEDEPQDRVHDVLAEAIFGDHPLGRRVLGSSEVIAGVPVPEIRGYHDSRYTAGNVVIAAAGSLDHAHIVELAERNLPLDGANGIAANGSRPERAPRLCFYRKETEQYHVCFGGPGIARADERRFALSILDAAFGGSTSSRLFREIREKRGLAYSVGSYTDQFVDDGAVAMYVGTRADNVGEACEIIGRELAELRDRGLDGGELARAKEHVKGRIVLGHESSAARMTRCARSVLFGPPLLSLDELLARIEAVTADEVAALANELYDPAALSAACIGPEEDRFRAAVDSVSPQLVA
jgi:predicted Zn-dependent peptidase